jgi:hypothetical protein
MSFGRNGDGWCAREHPWRWKGLNFVTVCEQIQMQSYSRTFSTSSKLLQQFKICKAVRGRAFNSHENPGIGELTTSESYTKLCAGEV